MSPQIKREISFVANLVQALALLASGIYFVARYEAQSDTAISKQTEILQDLREIRAREERIEKYLSSHDPNYWETAHKLEELKP